MQFAELYTEPKYQIYATHELHTFLSHVNDYLLSKAPHEWDRYPEGDTMYLLYKIARIGYRFLAKHYRRDDGLDDGFEDQDDVW